jgi:hypothetical protein
LKNETKTKLAGFFKQNLLGCLNSICCVVLTEPDWLVTELAGLFKQNLLGWFNRTSWVVQTEPAWLVQQKNAV